MTSETTTNKYLKIKYFIIIKALFTIYLLHCDFCVVIKAWRLRGEVAGLLYCVVELGAVKCPVTCAEGQY